MRVDEADKLEKARREAAPKARGRRMTFFRLAVGATAKIRFLWEYGGDGGGLALYRHSRSEKPKNVSCFKNVEYGEKDCPYCAANDKMKLENIWLIYNYTASGGNPPGVQLLSFKDTAYTPVKTLRAMSENFGTITDRDFMLQRVPAAPPKGGRTDIEATQYLIFPDSPTSFPLTVEDMPSREDVIETLRPWEIRQ